MQVVDNRQTNVNTPIAAIKDSTCFSGFFGGEQSVYMKVGNSHGNITIFDLMDPTRTWTNRPGSMLVKDYVPVNAVLTIS